VKMAKIQSCDYRGFSIRKVYGDVSIAPYTLYTPYTVAAQEVVYERLYTHYCQNAIVVVSSTVSLCSGSLEVYVHVASR
jgi:hypothetical protein